MSAYAPIPTKRDIYDMELFLIDHGIFWCEPDPNRTRLRLPVYLPPKRLDIVTRATSVEAGPCLQFRKYARFRLALRFGG